MDYASNRNKDKAEAKPPKNVEKVVVGEVLVQKKSVGRKFRETFLDLDNLTNASSHAWSRWLLPAGKNLLWDVLDTFSEGAKNKLFGVRGMRRSYSPGPTRFSYNSPISRASRESPRSAVASQEFQWRRKLRGEEIILSSREEAELVLERMNDIIDVYEVASLFDLHELLGRPTDPIENKWGWVFLGDVQILQVREGYLIDLPPAEPIS